MTARRVTDPDLRMWAGFAGLLLSGLAVEGRQIGRRETALFRAVNDLPDWLFVPAWPVMQGGTLGAAPVSAALAWGSGRSGLALRMLLGGTASWALAKVIKGIYRRPRPSALVDGTRCRGPEQSGLGYVSGHAAVATALAAAALGELGPRGRATVLAAAPTIGLSRIYVGAHLPLDVAGGAAMGLAVEALVEHILLKLQEPGR